MPVFSGSNHHSILQVFQVARLPGANSPSLMNFIARHRLRYRIRQSRISAPRLFPKCSQILFPPDFRLYFCAGKPNF